MFEVLSLLLSLLVAAYNLVHTTAQIPLYNT